MPNKASLKSIASYVPDQILNNETLEKMVDTSDEWITRRTGIKERRIANSTQNTSDIGYEAALIAIKRAGLKISDIDAIIVGTLSPDYFTMPSTACIIAAKLGLSNISAFDVCAGCTGFIYLLELARAYIESGIKKNVLIIGAEKVSSVMDYSDRSICILFGDGAGAGVVSNDANYPIIDTHTASDGRYANLLKIPRSQDASINKSLAMQMQGNEVFKIAVNTLKNDVINILNKNNIKSDQIDLFIPHQANLRIIKAVQDSLGFSDDKCVITIAKYGNTSSASIPMAMSEAYEQKRLKKGSMVLLDAFGGGLTWGSALLSFGGDELRT